MFRVVNVVNDGIEFVVEVDGSCKVVARDSYVAVVV